jgi:hypothetical protein
MNNKKRVVIDLDHDVYNAILKEARSHAARLKPYVELLLQKATQSQNL